MVIKTDTQAPPSPTMSATAPRTVVKEETTAPASYMPDKLLPPKQNRCANSTHRLSRLDIQRASTDVKRFVEARLESDFNLVKV
mmetsp:Transcript_34150/g.68891  ORF Transcript_34150/g.68891 Transcript_34150/m.68891 type:complete len:84 (+) Transcript_34150:270-521(+)